MKDCLQVDNAGGSGRSVLFDDMVDEQYRALNNHIEYVTPSSAVFKQIQKHIHESQVRNGPIHIANMYRVCRQEEQSRYRGQEIGNEQLVFHGSRIANWVGLWSRGILMPNTVVAMVFFSFTLVVAAGVYNVYVNTGRTPH